MANQQRVILQMRVPADTPGIYVGGTPASYEAEQEVILARDTKFRIRKVISRMDVVNRRGEETPSTFLVEVEVVP